MRRKHEKRYYNESDYNNRIYINVIMFAFENRLVVNSNNYFNGCMCYFKFLFKR